MITNYEGLDLGRYMKIDKVLRTPAEEIDKQVQIVAILSDMTPEQVLTLPLADYSRMATQTAFLGKFCDPAKVDGKPLNADGLRLVPTSDFTKITTAQYVDFQTFARDFPSTIPQLLSCFLIPEGKKYNDGYDIAEVHRAVLGIPLPVALGLTAFFFNSFNASIQDSLTSLERKARRSRKMQTEVEKMRAKVEGLLQSIGDGLQT